MATIAPRLAASIRVLAPALSRPTIPGPVRVHARPRPVPGVGCSHWVRYSSAKTKPNKAKNAANAAAAAEVDAVIEEVVDVGFCDEGEAEAQAEWGDEVEEGVFIDVPDSFTHARHAKAAEAQAEAGAESAPTGHSSPASARKVPTSIKHLNRLLSRHQVPNLPESELEEKFVRGRGPGGQAINKTNSSVCLTHIPTGIRVQAQPTRSREQNRYVARQILKDRLDLMRARGELPHPDGSFTVQKPAAEMSRKEKLAAEARTWSKQELRWEKERRRKLNRKKKVNKRKKAGAEEDEGGEGEESEDGKSG